MVVVSPRVLPVLLLLASNVFMTFASYGHLKFKASPLWIAVLSSWGIALIEYRLAIPANRIGYGTSSAAELKVIQGVITLSIFGIFSVTHLGATLTWNHAVGFAMIAGGTIFVFKGPF